MTDAVEAPATTTASGAEPAPSQPVVMPPAVAPAAAPAEPPAADAPPADKPAIPEKYEFANLPEGYTLDDASLGEWSGVFKELGLTQEQAQKLVEMDAKRFTAANSPEAQQKAAVDARNSQVSQWEAAIKQDKDLGGSNFEASVGTAQAAIAEFGSPELTAFLKESGLGSFPPLVKAFHQIGKQLGEGSLHRTTTAVPAERSIAERMYPNYPN